MLVDKYDMAHSKHYIKLATIIISTKMYAFLMNYHLISGKYKLVTYLDEIQPSDCPILLKKKKKDIHNVRRSLITPSPVVNVQLKL